MKKTEEKMFEPQPIKKSDVKEEHDVDLSKLYERTHSELTLQQTKRDQIITLFFSIFSLLVPLALSIGSLTYVAKGAVFLIIGVIGIIFSVIVIRYRIYKEVYWICCETITCMMNVKESALNKATVQTLFYKSLKKKGNNFCKETPDGEHKWSFALYCRKNLFSSETLHYTVVILLTAILLTLSVFLFGYGLPVELWLVILLCSITGVVSFSLLLLGYFINCQSVYSVLIDGKDSSFNKAFGKAWFLHGYVEYEDMT